MAVDPTKHLDSYELKAHPIGAAEIPRLHALSIGVGWPHRAEDWAVAIDLGQGVFAADEIGRVVGSSMWFEAGPDLAVLGMTIITPRLQEHGAGRWLVDHVLDALGSRDVTLNATRASFRLFLSAGFEPGRAVWQHQGVAISSPAAPGGARPMRPGDEAAVRRLDASAFSGSRARILDRLLAMSVGTVIERDGEVAGFALCRRFGRGYVIGPVVAEGEDDALAVIGPHVAAHAGEFLRLDTQEPEGPLRQYLLAAGLGLYDTVTSMTKGEPRRHGPARIFGLASHSFG